MPRVSLSHLVGRARHGHCTRTISCRHAGWLGERARGPQLVISSCLPAAPAAYLARVTGPAAVHPVALILGCQRAVRIALLLEPGLQGNSSSSSSEPLHRERIQVDHCYKEGHTWQYLDRSTSSGLWRRRAMGHASWQKEPKENAERCSEKNRADVQGPCRQMARQQQHLETMLQDNEARADAQEAGWPQISGGNACDNNLV